MGFGELIKKARYLLTLIGIAMIVAGLAMGIYNNMAKPEGTEKNKTQPTIEPEEKVVTVGHGLGCGQNKICEQGLDCVDGYCEQGQGALKPTSVLGPQPEDLVCCYGERGDKRAQYYWYNQHCPSYLKQVGAKNCDSSTSCWFDYDGKIVSVGAVWYCGHSTDTCQKGVIPEVSYCDVHGPGVSLLPEPDDFVCCYGRSPNPWVKNDYDHWRQGSCPAGTKEKLAENCEDRGTSCYELCYGKIVEREDGSTFCNCYGKVRSTAGEDDYACCQYQDPEYVYGVEYAWKKGGCEFPWQQHTTIQCEKYSWCENKCEGGRRVKFGGFHDEYSYCECPEPADENDFVCCVLRDQEKPYEYEWQKGECQGDWKQWLVLDCEEQEPCEGKCDNAGLVEYISPYPKKPYALDPDIPKFSYCKC